MRRVLSICIIFANFVYIKSDCHACFDNVCYSKAPVFEGHRVSGQIAVDRKSNILYFHYEDSDSTDYTASFDLDDIRFSIIPNIDFSFARTVDQSNRDVYFGGALGIYKYIPSKNTTNRFAVLDKTIWHMQFKGKIYYTVYMAKGLFTFESKKSKSVAALSDYNIDDFVIDKYDDVYFISNFTLYRLKKGAKQANLFANESYALATDKFNNAYFVQSASRGLFRLDYSKDQINEVGAFSSGIPTKAVFDSQNNVIYVDANSEKIYYLTPNYGRCIVSSKGKGKKLKKTVSTPTLSDYSIIKTYNIY